MPIHDATFSTLNMACQLYASLDQKQASTTLPTAQLELLLRTLIEIGRHRYEAAQKVSEKASSQVAGAIADMASRQREIAEQGRR